MGIDQQTVTSSIKPASQNWHKKKEKKGRKNQLTGRYPSVQRQIPQRYTQKQGRELKNYKLKFNTAHINTAPTEKDWKN